MQVFKIALTTLVVGILALGAAAAGVVYSGAYNVAATDKHWPITYWVLNQAVHRSVERQSADIEAPELGGKEQLLAGAANFDAMCSDCHAPPGGQQSVAARGMYPKPPELTHAAEEKSPAELFWVIKHGIKASAMPAWGASHSDEEMWAMTAFVEQLPGMSATDYRQMLQTAKAQGIGHGDEGHHDESDESHGGDHASDEASGRSDSHGETQGQPHSDPDGSAHAHG
ncbi:c-type cytochrome [Salinisphaera orenii]|uniref:Cytochrome C n=1 Tax=Salinisphaera orenii YIM 95161 TaxID=1051139 RepID=A0A423PDQ6_9GAMM|nr:cytochrome c [Salinisphaera halophila]ROO23131.1 cytochrome C [Salinisphaera halophila YIM 95161]